MNFKDYFNHISKNTKIEESDIFNFVDTPLELACTTIIEGYNRILNVVESTWGIGRCICFISNKTTVNARAILNDEYGGIIEIHKGLVLQWQQYFLKNDKLNSDPYIKSRLGYLKSNYNYEIGIELFKAASMYTLYHEVAHIIQARTIKEKGLVFDEEYEYGKIAPMKHILEIDADIFSSLTVSDHIIWNIINNLDLSKEDEQFIGDLISLNAASIFLTILSFASSVDELYFNKHSHPHPTLRNAITTSQFFTQLLEFTRNKNFDLEIDEEQIVEGIFNIVSHIFESKDKIEAIKLINSKNKIDIEKYYEEIQSEIKNTKWLATTKRDLIHEKKALNYG